MLDHCVVINFGGGLTSLFLLLGICVHLENRTWICSQQTTLSPCLEGNTT